MIYEALLAAGLLIVVAKLLEGLLRRVRLKRHRRLHRRRHPPGSGHRHRGSRGRGPRAAGRRDLPVLLPDRAGRTRHIGLPDGDSRPVLRCRRGVRPRLAAGRARRHLQHRVRLRPRTRFRRLARGRRRPLPHQPRRPRQGADRRGEAAHAHRHRDVHHGAHRRTAGVAGGGILRGRTRGPSDACWPAPVGGPDRRLRGGDLAAREPGHPGR